MAHIQKPEDIQWCKECGRYYNPTSPHQCNMVQVNEERHSLERFLKRYHVKSN